MRQFVVLMRTPILYTMPAILTGMKIMKTQYSLLCLGSGEILDDTDMLIESGLSEQPAFLRTVYDETRFIVGDDSEGQFKFRTWLPISRTLEGSSAPVTYKSEGLAKSIGLKNLYITFSGFWPERGVEMRTGTFKECEAYSVCARLPADFSEILVVASAGNTARAFIDVCSRNNIPLLVVVPEDALSNLWVDHTINPCVRIIAAGGDSDYFDAISVSRTICGIDGYRPEGGAKNVARRDGMGCTVLSAVAEIGAIPEFYFQAVGSGTGAIAAWEANLRLIEDGRYGDDRMKLLVSQNEPFVVIHDSWKRGTRTLLEIDPETARDLVARSYAKVLSNRKPPYSLTGGLYDALVDTDGDVLSVGNHDAEEAALLFEKSEGIDISPAAAVAVASLEQAVTERRVKRHSLIMLNITGGGYRRARERLTLKPVAPDVVIQPSDFDTQGIERAVEGLFSHV